MSLSKDSTCSREASRLDCWKRLNRIAKDEVIEDTHFNWLLLEHLSVKPNTTTYCGRFGQIVHEKPTNSSIS